MLFNSLTFAMFFVIVTLLYFILPYKLRMGMLLAASCYFYMYFVPRYMIILASVILIDYTAGILIENAEGTRRRMFLLVSIFTNIGLLFVFKYFNFFNSNIAALARLLHWNYPIKGFSLILPIGLSFHTFQSLSYVIEVYRGKQRSERKLLIYALYVMFYPQLVAGPIERPQNILHQLHEKHGFSWDRLLLGLRIMLWGFFKKMVVADRLAIYVDKVYHAPEHHNSLTLMVATMFFAIQIYCDFSGYSEIAIGAAKIMGINLMENFRQPYFSKSISEFWRRWHISLSTWFKDYLYIPLGGSRVPKWRRDLNLFITFAVSGLWHGASFTFIIWGSLNGIYLVIENHTRPFANRCRDTFERFGIGVLYTILKTIATFILICITWIFFRAKSLSQAKLVIKRIAQLNGLTQWQSLLHVTTSTEFYLCLVLILFLFLVDYVNTRQGLWEALAVRNRAVRLSFYYILIFAIIILGVYDVGTKTTFIYFQF